MLVGISPPHSFLVLAINSLFLLLEYLGGSQKYDGPAKLDFSFMSSGDDEGIPDELYEVRLFFNPFLGIVLFT